jgi:hypothetical protein
VVKLILKLIKVLLALKLMHQHFMGYLMLETLLNYLRVFIILETNLELFIDLDLLLVAIVLLTSFRFVMDLLALDLLLILELHRLIMLLKQSFIQLLLKNQLKFNYLRRALANSLLLFT